MSVPAQTPANDDSGGTAISVDGRFVAFTSWASNLVPGDTNGSTHVAGSPTRGSDAFVRDLLTGKTERVSVSSGGRQGNEPSYSDAISADGRFVAFDSSATNLVASPTNGALSEVFVRDRLKGTTELVSVSSSGKPADFVSVAAAISADGRFVAFDSSASNLIAGGAGGYQVYVHDRLTGTTEPVSVSSGGTEGNDDSFTNAISADGRFVVFTTRASNLVPGDTNGKQDVFVRDRVTGTTERVSVGSSGEQANGGGRDDAVSADGRFVAFDSNASNLVHGDTNGQRDVFVRDRLKGTTERVSLTGRGEQGNESSFSDVISADGRFVAFDSFASNLVAGDGNADWDVFLRDRLKRTTTLVSVGRSGSLWAGRLRLRPWPPRAGEALRATMRLHAGRARVKQARVTCHATLFPPTLAPRLRRISHSKAECVWQIPANARGKLLAGHVTAKNASGATNRSFGWVLVAP